MNKTKSKAAKERLSEKGRRYDCSECGKQIAKMSNLTAHIRVVHEGVQYSCQQCLYQATQKCHLEKHRGSVMKELNILVINVSIKQQQKVL